MPLLQNTTAAVDIENIGGIDSTTVGFTLCVIILSGGNATNRTSFLRALMAALGSDRASLKSDADQVTVPDKMTPADVGVDLPDIASD